MRKVAALLALSGTACTSMQVQHAPTTSVVREDRARQVRVRLKTGERVVLYDATLRGDSIVGYTHQQKDLRRVQRNLAVADVTEVAVAKFSAIKTVIAVGVVVASVAIIAGGSSGSSSSQSTTGCAPATVTSPT